MTTEPIGPAHVYSLQFQNLASGETRYLLTQLYRFWCELEDVLCYQLRGLDGAPVAEDAPTPEEAIHNGVWSGIPQNVWGWRDIARLGVS